MYGKINDRFYYKKAWGTKDMQIVLFVLGVLLFLGLGALIVYWVVDDLEQNRYFYRSICCEYIMALLVLLYYMFGSSIFGEKPHFWIVLCTSIVFFIFLCLYIFIYIILEEHFSVKLLLILPIFVLEIWQVIDVWTKFEEPIFSKDLRDTFIMALFTTVITILLNLFLKKRREKEKEKELFQIRYSRSNSDLPFEFYMRNSDLSGNVSDEINYLVFRLYQYAKENRLSPSLLESFLSHYEEIIPSSVRKSVINRFIESHYFNRMDSVNLIEFATILFPEFFGIPYKAYSSERYNLRLFEDFYVLSQRNLERSQAQLNELNSKMRKIEELLSGTVGSYKQDITTGGELKNIVSEESSQSIVREIFHLTKTPLLTITAALKNLSNNLEAPLTKIQKEKLSTIMDNVSTVKLILEAYRKLVTVTEISTSEDIVSYIDTAITSMCSVCGKQINKSISDFPEKIGVHGNNVIIILLMPLIHNAIEASPDKASISIKCVETNEKYVITVENTCEIPPKQNNLNTDGYSTKNDGGEGLRSVRRISKSIGIGFHIKVNTKNKRVVATLNVPKK